MSDQKKSEYLLKERAVIVVRGTSQVYSNANLTEEVALKFLKKNPNRKQLFSRLPKNIDELLKADDAEDTGSGDNKVETAAHLAKKGRKELDQIATDLELNPKDYSNKEEIAKAIFNKREQLKDDTGSGGGGTGEGSNTVDGGEGGKGPDGTGEGDTGSGGGGTQGQE